MATPVVSAALQPTVRCANFDGLQKQHSDIVSQLGQQIDKAATVSGESDAAIIASLASIEQANLGFAFKEENNANLITAACHSVQDIAQELKDTAENRLRIDNQSKTTMQQSIESMQESKHALDESLGCLKAETEAARLFIEQSFASNDRHDTSIQGTIQQTSNAQNGRLEAMETKIGFCSDQESERIGKLQKSVDDLTQKIENIQPVFDKLIYSTEKIVEITKNLLYSVTGDTEHEHDMSQHSEQKGLLHQILAYASGRPRTDLPSGNKDPLVLDERDDKILLALQKLQEEFTSMKSDHITASSDHVVDTESHIISALESHITHCLGEERKDIEHKLLPSIETRIHSWEESALESLNKIPLKITTDLDTKLQAFEGLQAEMIAANEKYNESLSLMVEGYHDSVATMSEFKTTMLADLLRQNKKFEEVFSREISSFKSDMDSQMQSLSRHIENVYVQALEQSEDGLASLHLELQSAVKEHLLPRDNDVGSEIATPETSSALSAAAFSPRPIPSGAGETARDLLEKQQLKTRSSLLSGAVGVPKEIGEGSFTAPSAMNALQRFGSASLPTAKRWR